MGKCRWMNIPAKARSLRRTTFVVGTLLFAQGSGCSLFAPTDEDLFGDDARGGEAGNSAGETPASPSAGGSTGSSGSQGTVGGTGTATASGTAVGGAGGRWAT